MHLYGSFWPTLTPGSKGFDLITTKLRTANIKKGFRPYLNLFPWSLLSALVSLHLCIAKLFMCKPVEPHGFSYVLHFIVFNSFTSVSRHEALGYYCCILDALILALSKHPPAWTNV